MLAVGTIVWFSEFSQTTFFAVLTQLGLELVSYFHLSPLLVVSQGVTMRCVPYLPDKKHHSAF